VIMCSATMERSFSLSPPYRVRKRSHFLKTDRLSDSERAMLMGGACAKAYRWSPKKG